MRALERARGERFRVEARFDNDTRRATPEMLVEDGAPRAVVRDALGSTPNASPARDRDALVHPAKRSSARRQPCIARSSLFVAPA